MRYATQGNGNYGDDASLESIDAPTEGGSGLGLPGGNKVNADELEPILSFFKIADIGNEDENSTELVGPKRITTLDVTGEPKVVDNGGLASVSPGSLSTIINGVNEGKKMSTAARIAYIMENGEPFCNHCEKNFIPTTISPRMACTNCGCGRPADDHGLGEENFSHVEGPTAKDLDAGKDIVKQDARIGTRLASTEDYVAAFNKTANDSELYYQGYTDAENGKPLDEDLDLLSKDYYNGYEQRKFYNKSPQQSQSQTLFDMKPNSNQTPRAGVITPGEEDRGPLELTDGFNHATASKIASIYPTDVIQNFFEV